MIPVRYTARPQPSRACTTQRYFRRPRTVSLSHTNQKNLSQSAAAPPQALHSPSHPCGQQYRYMYTAYILRCTPTRSYAAVYAVTPDQAKHARSSAVVGAGLDLSRWRCGHGQPCLPYPTSRRHQPYALKTALMRPPSLPIHPSLARSQLARQATPSINNPFQPDPTHGRSCA